MRYTRWPALLAVTTSGLLASALAVPSPAHAQVNTPVTVATAVATDPGLLPVTAALGTLTAAEPGRTSGTASTRQAPAPRSWTVRPGQTLSAIAAAAYGNAQLWPALWWVNKAAVKNPDLILAGQVLHLSAWHPQAAWLYRAGKAADGPPGAGRQAVHRAIRRAVRTGDGRIWGVTYGYPNYCCDGDGDGWDVSCGRAAARHAAGGAVARPARRSAVTYAGSGVYSYGALEALWISAGGPAWAASAAAAVAECESGGRVDAHNPSGATGLWQILGSVVAGNLDNPYVNALNAVAKFKASGDSWAQWVCKP